jgi:hypothetical protein
MAPVTSRGELGKQQVPAETARTARETLALP